MDWILSRLIDGILIHLAKCSMELRGMEELLVPMTVAPGKNRNGSESRRVPFRLSSMLHHRQMSLQLYFCVFLAASLQRWSITCGNCKMCSLTHRAIRFSMADSGLHSGRVACAWACDQADAQNLNSPVRQFSVRAVSVDLKATLSKRILEFQAK